jgi:PKD domain
VRGFTNALLVSLATLGACALVNGCSSTQTASTGKDVENTGSIGLNLALPGGVTVNAVQYTITGNGFTKTGSIDVSGQATISGTIGGIPAGNGFTITLTATSTDGSTNCLGSATFNVTGGTSTAVTVHLQCRGVHRTGSITLNGNLNVCPNVDELTATPQTLPAGSTVTLHGAASDSDAAPAALTYAWTTTAGTLGGANTPNATLTSATAGTATVTLTVSDGDCTDVSTTLITFTGAGGGGTGGTGAGGTGTAGTATGGTGTAGSATGGGGAGGTGTAGTATGGTGTAGTATGGTAGSGTAGSGGSAVTAESILASKSAACLSDAQAQCSDNLTKTNGFGTLAYNVLSCTFTTGCANTGTAGPCYCGTASGAACLGAGAANGPCKSQEEAGLLTTDPSTIATKFADETRPGGEANALIQCLIDNVGASCGFP